MNECERLKNTWKELRAKPSTTPIEVAVKANGYRKKQIISAVSLISTLAVTFVIIVLVIVNYDAKYSSTYWGIGLTLLAIALAIISQSHALTFLTKSVDLLSDNKTYLTLLQKQQRYQIFIHSKGISIYFILLSTGIGLYMAEFAMRSLIVGVVAYSVVGAWLGLNWFYFRPRIIKKQTDKLNALLKEVERVSSQME
ncbi:hypothetical protein BH10BAC4_BH10BAC4_12870 [soil metagenome]